MKITLRNAPLWALTCALSLVATAHAQDSVATTPSMTEAAPADAATAAFAQLQTRWAEIKYGVAEKEQPAAFEALSKTADAAVASFPDDPRILIWHGIVLSSWAGAKGGLGALSLVRRAKADFEAALAIDASALDGSAHTSLGSLYYQVPGWPVGFGDDDKAREHLQAGLALNPEGIDSNYFWGDYLREDGDKSAAVAAFEKALQAAPRPGRESADAGRRAEINAALAEVRG